MFSLLKPWHMVPQNKLWACACYQGVTDHLRINYEYAVGYHLHFEATGQSYMHVDMRISILRTVIIERTLQFPPVKPGRP